MIVKRTNPTDNDDQSMFRSCWRRAGTLVPAMGTHGRWRAQECPPYRFRVSGTCSNYLFKEGDATAILAASTQVGSDVKITLDASNSVLLKNVTLGALNQDDFMLA